MIRESPSSFTVKAGMSEIIFESSDSSINPFYHFAFNIPENQLKKAKEWISKKAELITLDGEDEFDFKSWNAHSVYFYDPAGNILELIARHDLENRSEKDFGGKSLLSVSEIGIPVFNVMDFHNELNNSNPLPLFSGDNENFTAMGDDNGLLIIVKKGRKWYPDCPDAEIFPLKIKLHSDKNSEIYFNEINFRIILSEK
ncbi:MAG TPA: ring-cleaving dioxygenase [Ignavibacteria bacterium]|nr:ring-cleaving dioxygenase [Ignavibacteria bacterium]